MLRHKRLILGSLILFIGIMLTGQPALAGAAMTVTGFCKTANQATLEVTITPGYKVDWIEIYRANQADGEYQLIATDDIYVWEDPEEWMWDGYEEADYTYTDPAILAPYQNYYYRVMVYQTQESEEYDEAVVPKTLVDSVDVTVYITGAGPLIQSGVRSGKNNAKLSWTQVPEADGYMIYCLTDMDGKGNIIYPDTDDESKYTLVKQINSNSVLSATFKKLTNGVTYTYRIYAFKYIDGVPVKSVSSPVKSIPMDYYAYASESYEQKVKRAFGSAKKMKKNFAKESKARKQMKTIKIKVWDFKNGKNGKKITKTKYLTVNKRLAPTIQQIFKEIYNSKEKQVIHDIGCYSYRTGEHMYGLAIDVNPNENYMIDGKKILSGRFWKPKKNKYSIPNDSEFVRIMNRYGFLRGDWGDRKDYMHFSYFGT